MRKKTKTTRMNIRRCMRCEGETDAEGAIADEFAANGVTHGPYQSRVPTHFEGECFFVNEECTSC